MFEERGQLLPPLADVGVALLSESAAGFTRGAVHLLHQLVDVLHSFNLRERNA